MKNDRIGESLWCEWDGELFEPVNENSIVYYTIEHIDLDNDVVKRALASALQRDGVSDSLSSSFRLVETGIITHGWVGWLEEEPCPIFCDEFAESFYGDVVQEAYPATFVEL